ncbi:MmcQ/YjbR family DNA-binding protein [Propionibacteriaceae bacterium Y2011]
MAHPSRFDEDDPYLAHLREICLALPSAAEKVSHGHPNFYTRKVFAVFGGMVKGDHHSDTYAQSVLVLPDPDEHAALLTDTERFYLPAYYGPSGWVGYDFRAGEVDWDEVAELVDASYRNTASRTLVRQLDAGV